MTIVLEAIKLNKQYKQHDQRLTVLRDVSCTTHQGQHTLIYGSAGCGTTTLLECLAGRRNPASGEVRTHAPLVYIYDLAACFRKKYTVQENIRFVAALFGVPHADASNIAFAENMNQPVRELSDSTVQQIATRCLLTFLPHTKASTVLLDAAFFIGFNIESQTEFFSEMTTLTKQHNLTLIITAREPNFGDTFFQQKLLLEAGTLHPSP